MLSTTPLKEEKCCINPENSDRQSSVYSVDPDQMPQIVASDLGLHCLPVTLQSLDTLSDSKWSDYDIVNLSTVQAISFFFFFFLFLFF